MKKNWDFWNLISDFSANGSYLKDEGRPLSAPETHLIDYQRSVDDLIHEDELR